MRQKGREPGRYTTGRICIFEGFSLCSRLAVRLLGAVKVNSKVTDGFRQFLNEAHPVPELCMRAFFPPPLPPPSL